MAHLLSLPENVLVQHLLPHLDHNDILRLRRVSKQAKTFADTYLWTPKAGHQGKWELEIDSNKEGQSLQAFMGSSLPPPPPRLRIVHKITTESQQNLCPCCRSFYEDDHLEEFMQRYGKYVTRLSVDVLQFPFASYNEIRFYESLVNLERLCAHEIKTVGGAAEFEEKARNADGGFLIRPTFHKLRNLNVISTDCMDSMWILINGVSDNLDVISHPFQPKREDDESNSDDGDDDNNPLQATLASVRALIERRRLRNQSKLLYDWGGMNNIVVQPLEVLPLFAVCRDNGVMIKNLVADILESLLQDEQGWGMGETYRGNLFVGNIIHSLQGLHDNVFLMELPALVKLDIHGTAWSEFRIWEGRPFPEWPNLRKLYIRVNSPAVNLLHFLCGCPLMMRPKLEELHLNYFSRDGIVRVNQLPLPCTRNLGVCCGNLKKLTLNHCRGGNNFFLGLWEGLPLLEEINLAHCPKLTNKGFVGNGAKGSEPVLLKLKNLKRLGIHNLQAGTRITDATFKNVFCHLKLSSFDLCSDEPVRSITLEGIKELLTGQFAETIEKLVLDGLRLEDVSDEELMEVVSLFRSSKML